jgi:BirA family transcriptional regulator, biotin operon repressor / biotin---[acetyl-CoA-carboxylase] ligase
MRSDDVTTIHGSTFLVSDRRGDVESTPDAPAGLFHADMRHLSEWVLLVDGRKICGILAESSVESVPVAAKRVGPGAERPVDFIILGVGLNANVDPRDLGVPDREAATLRSELGHDVDLLELLGSLLSHLDAELGRMEDFGTVLDDWRALNCTLGNQVRVRRFGEVLEGVALDLGPEGELLLKTRDGMVELVEGEIEQLRQGPI